MSGHLSGEISEVRVRITDIGSHPPVIVDDIKSCLIQSLSLEPQEVEEMRISLPSKLNQSVFKGTIYKLVHLWVEQIKAGVFLIIVVTYKDDGTWIPWYKRGNDSKRILAIASRKPSLKEACQHVIRSRVKTAEKLEKLLLPKNLMEDLRLGFKTDRLKC